MAEKLVPKLRFPSYSSEWHSYTLGEILTFYSTNSFSREKLNYDTGSVKNIHYGDIHTKFPSIVSVSDNKDIPFINNEIDLSKYSEDQYLQNGDLIIADASEDYEDIGKAIEVKNIDDEKVLAGLHTILARDNNNITVNGFKAYLFSTNSLKTKIKIIANGISVLGISKNSLSKLTVNVPSKNEQNDVVDFISLIDNKIELLEQKHQYYLDFKKFLMQQIFAQKLRFNFTDEWEKYLLGDISLIGKGFTPSTSNPSFWDGDLKWLSIADMNQGKYINQTTKKITSDGSKNKEPVKKGTLLMSFKLSIGKLGILTEDMYTNEAICNFKWKNKDVLTEYMYYYLSSINILKYGSQAAKGITLNNETLSTIPVLLPSLEEQKKIINILSDVDLKISMLENSINDTSKFKKGLLQQMFNYVRILYNLFEILIFLDHLLIFLIVFHTHYYSSTY